MKIVSLRMMTLTLLLFIIISSAYSEEGQVQNRKSLPRPPGVLIEIADHDEHFDYMLDHLADDPVFFNYLKTRYFALPVLQSSVLEKIAPEPKNALNKLRVYAVALKAMHADLFERLDEQKNYLPTQEEWKTFRMWTRYMGALAYGERVVNREGLQDGGSTYLELFKYSQWLPKEPDFFRQLIADYCQVARRPFRAMRDKKILDVEKTIPLFLPVLLAYNETFKSEPDLSRLFPSVISADLLNETWASIPDDKQEQFPVLYRMARMLIGCSRSYEEKNNLHAFFTEINIARSILEKCSAHEKFKELTTDEQSSIMDLSKKGDQAR